MPKKGSKKQIKKKQKENNKKPPKNQETENNDIDHDEKENIEQDQKSTIPLGKRQLLEKWGISFGPPGYIPSLPGTPKSVHVADFSMVDPGGGRELLTKTDIHIGEGNRYGLVGKNGFGKTTLLKLLSKYEIEGFPRHVRMILVNQEEELTELSVIDSVLKADEIREKLIEAEDKLNKKMDETEDEKEQDQINQLLQMVWNMNENLNYDQSEKRAMKILTGLGFTKEMAQLKTRELSGGWQTRVKLAKALFVEPDLMLLDEPTNHLDFPTVLWLQNYLKEYKKTVVVVSHDRTFLNEVCTHIILLAQKKLTNYKGNYDTMLKTQKTQFVEQNREYEALQKQIKEIKEWMRKYKDKGEKMAAQVHSKSKVLEKLEEDAELLAPPEPDKELSFLFPDIGGLEDYVCRMVGVQFKYPNMDNLLLNNVTLQIDMDTRIGMIGENGVGKSTLVKIIMGKLEPTQGECLRNRHARIALFTQYHMDQLNLEVSAIDFVMERFADDEEMKEEKDKIGYVRRRLGKFNLTGKQHLQPMKYLSGGQKSRVAFCIATWRKPHFLIMDEPTNHLDMDTIDSLITAVKEFHGGVLVISHDQHFLKNISKSFWAVTREKIQIFEDFEDAKEFALSARLKEVEDEDEDEVDID